MSRNHTRLGFTALALVAGHVMFAQDATTGAVFGTVKNNKGIALADAKVILDGGRGQMEYATDVSGQFRITGLIPGRYSITVIAAGYERMLKQTLSVGVNQRTPINVVLTAAAAATVEVVASAGTIDATTATSGAQFASEQFSTLPLGRSFLSVANMAPGVVSSGVDAANPSIAGGSGLENQYVIDGANTTNPGYGSSGSYSGTYGSLGSGINSDFIAEVQVKSFALDAEYGQTTGGIVNAITKSGSNTFEGSAFAYFDIDSLQALNKVPNLTGVDAPTFVSANRTELGFTVSGPIIKDKLFYFVGFNPITSEVKRRAPHNSDIRNDAPFVYPEYTLAGQEFKQKTETNAFYAKVQWQINTSHLLELSTFGDPGKRPFGPQANGDYRGDTGRFSELKFGSSTVTAKYNGLFLNDFLVEARVSNVKTDFKRTPSASGLAQFSVADVFRGGANQAPNAAGLYEVKQDGDNTQFDIKLSKTFGNLDLKVGYLHEDVKFDSEILRSGPFFHVPDFGNPNFPNGVDMPYGITVQRRYILTDPTLGDVAGNYTPIYRITRGNFSKPTVSTKTKYDAYFIQGNYKLGNFNFKGGLRWEQQKLVGEVISYTFKASDNMAPRLSVTWDLDGTGKSKLYAFWGRYFEKVPLDIAVRALSEEKGVNRADFRTMTNYTSLSDPIMNGTEVTYVDLGKLYLPDAPNSRLSIPSDANGFNRRHFGTTGDETTQLLPGTKSMYQDELVFGYDHEIANGITISDRFMYKKLGRILEDISLDGNSYYIGNPGETDAAFRQLTGFTGEATFPAPTRTYYAFEVEVRKNTGKLTGFMNLRLAKAEGNYEGLFRGDNGQDDPNISSLYDLPIEQMADSERGLTGREQFLIGALPSDRTIVLNGGISYAFDFGLSLGSVARLQTGTPLTTYLAHPVYENAGEIPQYGRGTEGRTPTTWTFDLSASYMWKIAKNHRLTFRADVFNFFNQQKITSYDTNADTGYQTTNVNYMRALTFDAARSVRLGVKYSF